MFIITNESQLIVIPISDTHYWRDTENQRKFFIEFAKQRGFDSFVPGNWDKIPMEDITKQV